MDRTDSELISLVRGGNKRAFGDLIERHQARARRVALSMVPNEAAAQELVQEALLQAYLSLDRLRDDPGPREGRVYAELSGGPLDGLLLDVTDHGPAERRHGVGLPTEIGRYGPGGRAVYAPRAAGDRVYEWRGDVP